MKVYRERFAFPIAVVSFCPIALGGFLLWAAVSVEEGEFGAILDSLVFLAIGMVGLFFAFYRRVVVSQEGVTVYAMWKRRFSAQWSEITRYERVKRSPNLPCAWQILAAERKSRLPFTPPELQMQMLEHVPASAWAEPVPKQDNEGLHSYKGDLSLELDWLSLLGLVVVLTMLAAFVYTIITKGMSSTSTSTAVERWLTGCGFGLFFGPTLLSALWEALKRVRGSIQVDATGMRGKYDGQVFDFPWRDVRFCELQTTRGDGSWDRLTVIAGPQFLSSYVSDEVRRAVLGHVAATAPESARVYMDG